MAYTNSSLVSYVKLSPNYNKRLNKIKKITIHHMAGNLSVESCGNIFAKPARMASSNYAVGTDGRIAMYVEEKNRSWCSSNATNDHQAITIEVANDSGAPNWHVSDKALAATIDLCVDICKRNGIEKLVFTGNKNGNLTLHKYFAATACPGPYLESKIPYIVEQVNKRLGLTIDTALKNGDTVKLKAGSTYYDGKKIPNWLFGMKLYVRSITNDRVVVSTLKVGPITGAVNIDNLVKG